MSHIEENNLTELQENWLATLQACNTSGKSMVAYARDNDLIVKDLYTWKEVLIAKGLLPQTHKPRFTKAVIQNSNRLSDECRIIFPNGVTVVISGNAGEINLTSLLSRDYTIYRTTFSSNYATSSLFQKEFAPSSSEFVILMIQF